jgi:hypothetical protein
MDSNVPKWISRRERAAVRRLVDRVGANEARRLLGISQATLARILADLPVARGTAALVRAQLAETP